jgi:phosphate transport system protein
MVSFRLAAVRLVAMAGSFVPTPPHPAALALPRHDDEMDKLHRALFTALLDKDSPYGVKHAVDVTSIGRYYERFADHPVSVARRVVYLVTGQMPQELTEGV